MKNGKPRQQSRHLSAFILLLIAREPLHGGAIQTKLEQSLPALKADSAAIYRVLQQLEQDGEVTAEWDTSQSGPARKVYSLSATGWEKLDFWRDDIANRIGYLNFFLTEHKRLQRKRRR